MGQTTKELQQLKGIGRVLAQRLKAAGLESYHAVAEAGEEGLQQIRGIKPGAIISILNQAGELAQAKLAARQERVAAFKQRIGPLRAQVDGVAGAARERFAEELQGKLGKKLLAEIDAVEAALKKMDEAALGQLKRAGRGLDKVEKRLAGLEEAGVKKVRKGLKRSKKAILKAIS